MTKSIYDLINREVMHKSVSYKGTEWVVYGLDEAGRLKLMDSKDSILCIPVKNSNLLKIIEEKSPQFAPPKKFAPSRQKGCKY